MDTNDSDKFAVPTESAIDRAIPVVKAAIDLVPGLGSSINDLLFGYLRTPLQKRYQEWMETVGQGLSDLEHHAANFSYAQAFDDENFVTAFIAATDAAWRTHHQEKREALRNAVLNAALPSTIQPDLQQMFIRYTRDLEPNHLALLQLLNHPMEALSEAESAELMDRGFQWALSKAATTQDQLNRAMDYVTEVRFRTRFPDLMYNYGFAAALVNDLRTMGLVDGEWPRRSFDGISVRVTDMGRQFLNFITSPIPDPSAGGDPQSPSPPTP